MATKKKNKKQSHLSPERYIREKARQLSIYRCFKAHNWIYGALDWATNAGISPCKEFALTRYLLEEDDDNVELIEYDFGLNGKYCLSTETMQESNRYLPILNQTLGEGNFEFIPPIDSDDYSFEEEENSDDFASDLDGEDSEEETLKYTYSGGDYPKKTNLNHPEILPILAENPELVSDDDIKFVLSNPENTLRADLQNTILYNLGLQWGKTKYDFDDETLNRNVIPNALMFLIEVGSTEETLPVVLEVLRQNKSFINFNFGDILYLYINSLLYKFCKDNPELLKPFLLEQGLTALAKNIVLDFFEQTGLKHKDLQKKILDVVVDVLEQYKKELPELTICDGNVVAFGINVLVSFGSVEYLPLIEKLYESEMIDEFVSGDLKSVKNNIHNPKKSSFYKIFTSPYQLRDGHISWV